MKINVEFDLTPDEFRRALGLPDVEAFQKNLLDNIQHQMEAGAEGYDPMNLMKPFLQQPMMQQGVSQGLSQGLSNFGSYQQMMLDMLRQAGNTASDSGGSDSDSASQKEPSRPAKSSATHTHSNDASKKTNAGPASASSRTKRSGKA